MEVLLYVGVGLAAVVVLLLVLAAVRSPAFAVERSTTVAAPPAAVFPHVNDLRQWAAWSPFEKLDPKMVKTFEGPPAGVGASYHWKGNAKAGEGRMTVTDSRPADRVAIALAFVKPFRCVHDVAFTFVPAGDQTRVTWRMSGRNPYLGRLFGLVMNMNKMIGCSFEKGLAALKAVVEGRGKADAA